jgi:hypothetical protein
MVEFILMLLAVICLGLAAFGVNFTNRISIGFLGLFFWALTVLIAAWPTL